MSKLPTPHPADARDLTDLPSCTAFRSYQLAGRGRRLGELFPTLAQAAEHARGLERDAAARGLPRGASVYGVPPAPSRRAIHVPRALWPAEATP